MLIRLIYLFMARVFGWLVPGRYGAAASAPAWTGNAWTASLTGGNPSPVSTAKVTRALGAFGSVARAVVFVLTGVFLIRAAVLSSADQAKGLDAVFRSVASSQYGPWLLALLASGLFCYGLYCLIEARYRDLAPGQ